MGMAAVRGLDSDLREKMAARYSDEDEALVRQWIEDVLGETLEAGCDNMMEQLKSGVILCNLMNALVPGSISKINKGKLAFHQIDNIGKFLTAASEAGLPSHDTFTTPELFESKMRSAVLPRSSTRTLAPPSAPSSQTRAPSSTTKTLLLLLLPAPLPTSTHATPRVCRPVSSTARSPGCKDA